MQLNVTPPGANIVIDEAKNRRTDETEIDRKDLLIKLIALDDLRPLTHILEMVFLQLYMIYFWIKSVSSSDNFGT